ncbi:NTF2 domain-containing protein [Mycobacterium sp. JS623]|uniref:nuclear transport factor 2 family protein n=1 Tax=Mycobacterium sp. JS623 TaxID=212767 RepID=UPI0002A59EF5|nr:nuclear transport factor 2 family protein [Mycobacterium sp. JS623]AGB25283.1 NTF2 domain-containing protein [Mycobacterium sp. JS623]
MPSAEDITQTVTRYLDFVSRGQPDEVASLYADDATVEDPVGGEVHIGRQAIRGFYGAIENVKAETEVLTLRAIGNEAAFHWTLSLDFGGNGMRIDIISTMTFDEDSKISSMKAYWSQDNVTTF